MKKIISLCLVLVLMISLCACQMIPAPASTESEEPTQASELPSMEVITTEPEEAQPVFTIEDQIALFVSYRDEWLPTEDYGLPYSFAVTDLDQNGRLELFVSICMGTGMVSVNRAWMVNEQADGIAACDEIFSGEKSQPELLYDQAPVYLDGEGCYHYIFTDSIRNGWEYQASVKYALQMDGEQLNSLLLASLSYENDIEGNATITCVDAAGVSISMEEYEVYEGMYFSECVPMTATFSWQMYSLEDLAEMDANAFSTMLGQSWAGFSLN